MMTFNEFSKPEYIEDTSGDCFKFKIEGEIEILGKTHYTSIISESNWNDFDLIIKESTTLCVKNDLPISFDDIDPESQEKLLKLLKLKLKNHMRK